MARSGIGKILSIFLSMVLAVSFAFPVEAIAAGKDVAVTDGQAKVQSETRVSGIAISGIDAPQVGVELDGTATVTASGGETWEIPVLWVDDNLQLCTQMTEGQVLYPVLVFFLPEGYAVDGADEGGGFVVALSEELAQLFGGNDVITVYDNTTGTFDITYIMPGAVQSYFGDDQPQEVIDFTADAFDALGLSYLDLWDDDLWDYYLDDYYGCEDDYVDTSDAKAPVKKANASKAKAKAKTPTKKATPKKQISALARMVNLYCSKTARNAYSQADLEYLVNLIVNKLQPQATNLLLQKFPAFKSGAAKGEIGKTMGLYVYYKTGDKDKDPAHQTTLEDALAYVGWNYSKVNGKVVYGYVMGVDAMAYAQKDKAGNLVKDAKGYYKLVRTGSLAATMENTIVHEMFHAFMDDYNRTGMAGTTSTSMAIINSSFSSDAQRDLYNKTAYPKWFREGTASAVENNYTFRRPLFELLNSEVRNGDTVYAKNSANAILTNYLSATINGQPANFHLNKSYDDSSSATARYVTGYLAVLYLGELAARANPSVGTSRVLNAEGNFVAMNSEKIRLGVNSILERMHKGETLDQVIYSISPLDKNGNKLYANTDKFEDYFITGPLEADGYYRGGDSLGFVSDFLWYMDKLENISSYKYHPNGSILFDFAKDYETPLDRTKNAASVYYKINGSNTYTKSTVPDSVALAGGGTSMSGTNTVKVAQVSAASDQAADDTLALAAKMAEPTAAEAAAAEPEVAVAEPEAAAEPEGECGDAGAAAAEAASEAADAGAAGSEAEAAAAAADVAAADAAGNGVAEPAGADAVTGAAVVETETPVEPVQVEQLVEAAPVVEAAQPEPAAEPAAPEPVAAETTEAAAA